MCVSNELASVDVTQESIDDWTKSKTSIVASVARRVAFVSVKRLIIWDQF
eukprot:m.218890 g.218890  ORF g.218890 m.218890 type:complete len:50 (-) comp33279_c0_seq1:646-795(-)